MLQATGCDGCTLDAFTRGEDCLGPAEVDVGRGQVAQALVIADVVIPDWDWRDISAHLRCTKCDTVGYVDTRLNWSEVINFNKGVG
jgi:hypothetical protein